MASVMAAGSRIQNVLEDANIKLASVASNTLGKSGRAILHAIISGEENSERLADLALGHLRLKIAKALGEAFGAMPRSRIALETGTHSPWISRLLSASGYEVIVA